MKERPFPLQLSRLAKASSIPPVSTAHAPPVIAATPQAMGLDQSTHEKDLGTGLTGSASLYDHPDHGFTVVKTGMPTTAARNEMRAEIDALTKLNGTPGVPRLLGSSPESARSGVWHATKNAGDGGYLPLSRIQASGTRISPAILSRAFGNAQALAGKIHAQGIVHNDMKDKPEHIWIHPQTGQVKFIDFGNAKSLNERDPMQDYKGIAHTFGKFAEGHWNVDDSAGSSPEAEMIRTFAQLGSAKDSSSREDHVQAASAMRTRAEEPIIAQLRASGIKPTNGDMMSEPFRGLSDNEAMSKLVESASALAHATGSTPVAVMEDLVDAGRTPGDIVNYLQDKHAMRERTQPANHASHMASRGHGDGFLAEDGDYSVLRARKAFSAPSLRPFPLQLSRLAKASNADLGTKDGSHLLARLSSGQTEFSKRMQMMREQGLIRPITMANGTTSKDHDYIVVGGRPVIHANIHGVTVPMYMHSGDSMKVKGQEVKRPGFLPFGGVLADGYFSKLHQGAESDENVGWGNSHIRRVMNAVNYGLFGSHVPPRRLYSESDLPDAHHISANHEPEAKKVNGVTQRDSSFNPVMIPLTPQQEQENGLRTRRRQSLAAAQQSVLPATRHVPLQDRLDHQRRGGEALPATIAAITSQIDANAGKETAPGVTHSQALGTAIKGVHATAGIRNNMLQGNKMANMTVPAATPETAKSWMTPPFPLQLENMTKSAKKKLTKASFHEELGPLIDAVGREAKDKAQREDDARGRTWGRESRPVADPPQVAMMHDLIDPWGSTEAMQDAEYSGRSVDRMSRTDAGRPVRRRSEWEAQFPRSSDAVLYGDPARYSGKPRTPEEILATVRRAAYDLQRGDTGTDIPLPGGKTLKVYSRIRGPDIMATGHYVSALADREDLSVADRLRAISSLLRSAPFSTPRILKQQILGSDMPKTEKERQLKMLEKQGRVEDTEKHPLDELWDAFEDGTARGSAPIRPSEFHPSFKQAAAPTNDPAAPVFHGGPDWGMLNPEAPLPRSTTADSGSTSVASMYGPTLNVSESPTYALQYATQQETGGIGGGFLHHVEYPRTMKVFDASHNQLVTNAEELARRIGRSDAFRSSGIDSSALTDAMLRSSDKEREWKEKHNALTRRLIENGQYGKRENEIASARLPSPEDHETFHTGFGLYHRILQLVGKHVTAPHVVLGEDGKPVEDKENDPFDYLFREKQAGNLTEDEWHDAVDKVHAALGPRLESASSSRNTGRGYVRSGEIYEGGGRSIRNKWHANALLATLGYGAIRHSISEEPRLVHESPVNERGDVLTGRKFKGASPEQDPGNIAFFPSAMPFVHSKNNVPRIKVRAHQVVSSDTRDPFYTNTANSVQNTESYGHANHIANLPLSIPRSALASPALSHLADQVRSSDTTDISGSPLAHAATNVFQVDRGRITKPMTSFDTITWTRSEIPKESITEYGPNGSMGLKPPDTFVPYSESKKLLGEPVAQKSLRSEMAMTIRMLERLEKQWQR